MPPRIPIATYRLQLTKDFGFAQAAALVPYLDQLGISHLYASPFLAARPGSTHGYDIVDHSRLSSELGGDEGFAQLSNALHEADLGLILDFVPNHMGIGFSDNAWWLDVLEWGQKSPHAASFDIDWNGLPYRAQPGVLLPILGRPYGDALGSGEIKLKYDADEGSFSAWYFEHKLPINPQRYGEVLRTVLSATGSEQTPAGRKIIELVERYPGRFAPSYNQAPEYKRALAAIPEVAQIIDNGLAAYRADTENGFPLLHRMLERQAYHLAYWRVAFSAINYRRFFDVNDLAGLRPEHPATFHSMHVLVARLIAEERLHGLRLDHIDGLRDPAQYVRRLREMIRRVRPGRDGYYLLIEKILANGEAVPRLRADGTTGYERLNLISRALLDTDGLAPLEHIWCDFTGERASFREILVAAKLRVLDTMLASEFTVLTRAVGRIAAGHFSSRDYTLNRLRVALQAYLLEFPVYRTYITAATTSDEDRAMVRGAIGRARASWKGPDPEIFDFLQDAITGDLAHNPGFSAPRVRNFALKLQQFTGPLMAKSLEDTAFYRYHRLLALNEVGGDPVAPTLSLDDFHREQVRLAKDMPHGLVATATHDTKRGEDARMRILALAEIPHEWREEVVRWSVLNARFVFNDATSRSPSTGHEYMLYQALIGAWPFESIDGNFVQRMQAYALKAAREGKLETSWTNPNDIYEARLSDFIANILHRKHSVEFIEAIGAFAQRTGLLGALNSLSQLALKLTLPGVPDFYQGTELWDLSLVDPDNRRPVDFAARRALLEGYPSWRDLLETWQDGRIKLALMCRLLAIRRTHADLFRNGDYVPLLVEGEHARHVIGFARSFRRKKILVLVGRHFARPTASGRAWPHDWRGRIVGAQVYRDLLRGGIEVTPQLNELFRDMPVAVLAEA